MAIENIATGYNPQFALGALYHGLNAGSQDNANQLANLAKEWELQKSQAEDPYKVLSSMYQGQLDNAKMSDPNYIPWQLAGQIGQMQTQQVAGRKAQATAMAAIDAEKQKLENDLATGQIDAQFYKYKKKRLDDAMQGGGQIGFPMQPQQDMQPSNFNPNYGNEGRQIPILKNEATMKSSMGNDYYSGSKPYDLQTIDQEIARTKDPKILPILQAERARIQQELQAGGGGTGTPNMGAGTPPVFANMQQSQQSVGTNPWLQGINPADPVMSVMMDDPKFRQNLALGEQKTDAAETMLDKRLVAARQLAAIKQKAVTGDKTAQQALVSYLDRMVASGKMSDAERAQHLSEYENARFAAKIQPGPQVDPSVAPGVLTPKPEQPKVNIGSSGVGSNDQLKKAVIAAGVTYEPNIYEYRVNADGTVQRKKKD